MQLTPLSKLNGYLSFQEIRKLFSEAALRPHFQLRTLGESECYRPIEMLSFAAPTAHSPKAILLYGGEDATEPVFSQTLAYLIKELSLSESELHAYHWHLISCINPDGYVRNEDWFDFPGDLRAFFENAWEDVHSRMIFMNASRPETRALHKAFEIIQPDFVFNLHDESHFPADGYQFACSRPIDMKAFDAHLARVGEHMDISQEELLITDEYGHDPVFSVHPALQMNPHCFIFLNEACGYRRVKAPSDRWNPAPLVRTKAPLTQALSNYQALLEQEQDPFFESALFHVRCLLQDIEEGKNFNSKMLALTGYGLVELEQRGGDVKQLKDIYDQCLGHILKHFQTQYEAVPVEQQVFAQLDGLLTVLENDGV